MGTASQKVIHGRTHHQKFGSIKLVSLQNGNQPGNDNSESNTNNKSNTHSNTHSNSHAPAPTLMEIEMQDVDDALLKGWASKLAAMRSGLPQIDQFVFLPVEYHNYSDISLLNCHSKKKVKFICRRYDYLLSKEIESRKKHKYHFNEVELWYMLYHLVQAKLIFQGNAERVGDIHPRNILLNDDGHLKVIAYISLPYQTDSIAKIKESKYADVFLSPEEIDQIVNGKQQQSNISSHNSIKHQGNNNTLSSNTFNMHSQEYSIGMTVLQCSTLQDCYFVYSRNPLKINYNKMQEIYKVCTQKYSPLLCNILVGLLQYNPKRRLTCLQIHEMLRRYEQQILNMQPFQYTPIDHSFNKSHYTFEKGREIHNSIQQTNHIHNASNIDLDHSNIFQLSISNQDISQRFEHHSQQSIDLKAESTQSLDSIKRKLIFN